MLAYAAHRRTHRRLSPTMLTLIVGGHALAIGLLITARMNPGTIFTPTPTTIYNVPLPKPVDPPPLPEPQPRTEQQRPTESFVERTNPVVPLPGPPHSLESGPPILNGTPEIGTIIETPLPQVLPQPLPAPRADPVLVQARAITPADLLRPPYPDSKVRSEEEAVLRLRLGIDQRGRVVSVDPVGAADPAFLASARSHLIRYWRYRPATEDGRAVASTLVITLRFELEE
ncbi:hypothetical protein GCM10022280_01490 [Sphingomonas swuensis]|uniref:TonB C-terminal domain-containing protein n=1 Tax=Sphingomonas swuensis TaxID=977800 RepID=A0ABP7S9X0_9SPHN